MEKSAEETINLTRKSAELNATNYTGEILGDLINDTTPILYEYEDIGEEYPEVGIKEVVINFWNLGMAVIFGFMFSIFSIVFGTVMINTGNNELYPMLLFVGVFGIIGLISMFIFIRLLIRYIIVRFFGRKITGQICEYYNDTTRKYDDVYGKIYKIIVNTSVGYRYIRFNMNGPKGPFVEGDMVEMLVYKDLVYLFVK